MTLYYHHSFKIVSHYGQDLKKFKFLTIMNIFELYRKLGIDVFSLTL